MVQRRLGNQFTVFPRAAKIWNNHIYDVCSKKIKNA